MTAAQIRIKDSWIQDSLRTYTEHIAIQVKNALEPLVTNYRNGNPGAGNLNLLVTGGGAQNTFLVDRLKELLQEINVEVVVPDKKLADYKEAVIMGLIGVLRWREENNVLASVTGAPRNSIGGAVWIGQEA